MNHLREDFIAYLKAEITISKNTLEAYRHDLNSFFNYSNTHNLSICDITQENIEQYIASLHNNFSNNSINRKISSLKHFYIFLLQEELINANPLINIELLKKPRTLPKFLSHQEIKLLLLEAETNQQNDLRVYLMLELLYATGMRVTELVSLKKSVIKYDYGQISPFLIINGKGNKERLVPLHNKVINLLEKYLLNLPAKEIYIFPSESKQGHITRQRFGQLLKDLAIKANINPEKVSPHIIRHSFATHIMDNGANIKIIQEILGHADISTTQIYTHLTKNKLKNIVNQFHPLSDLNQPNN